MRTGRLGENFNPVQKENSVRHSTGSALMSPAINCSQDVSAATARRSLASAA